MKKVLILINDTPYLTEKAYYASGNKTEVPKDFVGIEPYGGGKGESIIELQHDELT